MIGSASLRYKQHIFTMTRSEQSQSAGRLIKTHRELPQSPQSLNHTRQLTQYDYHSTQITQKTDICFNDEEYEVEATTVRPDIIRKSAKLNLMPRVNNKENNSILSSSKLVQKPKLEPIHSCQGYKLIRKHSTSTPASVRQMYNCFKSVQNNEKVRNQIQLDVQRTFSQTDQLKTQSLKDKQLKLTKLLNAIVVYHKNNVYAQGQNYLVVGLMSIAQEEYLIFGLYRLIDQKIHFNRIYSDDLQVQQNLCRLLKTQIDKRGNQLCRYMDAKGIQIEFFYFQWLQSFFYFIVPSQAWEQFIGYILKHGLLYINVFASFLLLEHLKPIKEQEATEILIMLTQKQTITLQVSLIKYNQLFNQLSDKSISVIERP